MIAHFLQFLYSTNSFLFNTIGHLGVSKDIKVKQNLCLSASNLFDAVRGTYINGNETTQLDAPLLTIKKPF